MAPTYQAEVAASYRSPEYHDNPPAICAECRQLIAADEDREVTAHPGEFVHLSCFQVRAQREDEGFFLPSLERIHVDLAELLREYPATGRESTDGALRRARGDCAADRSAGDARAGGAGVSGREGVRRCCPRSRGCAGRRARDAARGGAVRGRGARGGAGNHGAGLVAAVRAAVK